MHWLVPLDRIPLPLGLKKVVLRGGGGGISVGDAALALALGGGGRGSSSSSSAFVLGLTTSPACWARRQSIGCSAPRMGGVRGGGCT